MGTGLRSIDEGVGLLASTLATESKYILDGFPKRVFDVTCQNVERDEIEEGTQRASDLGRRRKFRQPQDALRCSDAYTEKPAALSMKTSPYVLTMH